MLYSMSNKHEMDWNTLYKNTIKWDEYTEQYWSWFELKIFAFIKNSEAILLELKRKKIPIKSYNQ